MLSKKFQTVASLSSREMEILELVSNGLTNLEIADKLKISKRTVDNHVSNTLAKTKTENRVELLRWALQWGKICLNDVNCCSLPISHQVNVINEVVS
ncbi:helix-turn-helix domain-containing protein [Cyanobacterium sp. uoEpiScrs1]|uniref:photosynthetic electron transport-dependent transcriptional regulator PedR n=1 Tax=Cyanobacterium sp. uoEpiScrs1 TaxID=2976343 RepID=UPI00226994C6|nr:helix-turn-helix transcriptional regulator [Cyanobacterium sp. uoEpiScrs1]